MTSKGGGSFRKNERTGLWESRIELPTIDGKRRRLVRRSKDRNALRRHHTETLNELAKYGDLPSASPTLEKYLERWLAEKSKDVAPNTMTGYRSMVRKHIVPAIGSKRLARLTPLDVKTLHNAVKDAGWKSTHALGAHRVLSTALSDAVNDGLMMTNPAMRTRAPRKSKTELEAFSLDESLRLLGHIAREPDGARWATALLTGARRGEVIGLEVDRLGASIDLSWQLQRIPYAHGCKPPCGRKRGADCPKRTIDVPEDYEYRHVEGGLYLTRPKSRDGWRIVPLVDPLLSILERHLSDNPTERFVFHRGDGRPIDPSQDSAAWRRVLARSGIEKDVRLHDVRHTTVDLLLAAGVPLEVVRLIVGHANERQTIDYSSRANADPRLRDAMERLSSLLTLRTLEPGE